MKKLSTLPLPTRPPKPSSFHLSMWHRNIISWSRIIKQTISLIVFTLIFSICFTQRVYAQIVISEVYPNPASGESEWIELFNAGSEPVSLASWKLQDQLSSPSDLFIFTDQALASQQYLLITLSSAKLNNAADGVALFQADGTVHTSMQYASSEQAKSWQLTSSETTSYILVTPTPTGINPDYPLTTHQPAPPSTPTPSATPIPTPTPSSSPSTTPSPSPSPTTSPSPQPTTTPTPAANTSPSPIPFPSTSPTPTVSLAPSPSPTPSPDAGYSTQLLAQLQLTEIMACPASGTEWVEFYNPTDQNITVTNWKITDESGNIKTLTGALSARAWSTLSWTGSLLNNSGDSLSITTATGQVIAQASYTSCTNGQSHIFSGNGQTGAWVLTDPTPGAQNPSILTDPTNTTDTTTFPFSSSLLDSLTSNTFTTELTDQIFPGLAATNWTTESQLLDEPPKLTFSIPDFELSTEHAPPATKSSFFVDNSIEPPKKFVIGGILSGLLTITSSGYVLYGKKLLTLITSSS